MAGAALLVIIIIVAAMFLQPQKIIDVAGNGGSMPSPRYVSADEVVAAWIGASPAIVRQDKDASASAARKLRDAIGAGGQIPTPAQAAAVVNEILRTGDRWEKYYGQKLPAKEWWTSLQYMVYYYLHPADLTPQQVAVRDQQHRELQEIMARLPQRMLKEWRVPVELEEELISDNRQALSHYESLLGSAFLRPSQVPLGADEFMRLKERMGGELDRLGKSLSETIGSNEQEWKSSLSTVRSTLPGNFGAELLGPKQAYFGRPDGWQKVGLLCACRLRLPALAA